MRLSAIALGLAFVAVTSFSALAEKFETPEAMLEALYAPYIAGGDIQDYSPFFSDNLNALYATDSEKANGEVGAIDFDPVIAGQDFEITKFAVGATEVDGNAAKVTVTFDNFETPETLIYSLVKEDDTWKVDDIESATPDFEYKLSQIFADATY